jgi:hypothetical protein
VDSFRHQTGNYPAALGDLDVFPFKQNPLNRLEVIAKDRFFFAFSAGVLYAGFATWEVAEWTFKKN